MGILVALAALAFATWLYLRPNRADLPSSGDTSCAAVVLRDGALWASDCTSDPARDWPWLLGMFLRSAVRIARIPVESLVARADSRAQSGSASTSTPTSTV